MTKSLWYFEEADLFKILCPHKYKDFCNIHPLDCYKKSDFLFFPEDRLKEIYLIASGKVKIGQYDEEGKEQVKAILSKGDILGEMAFLGETRHKDFAEVIENKTFICKLNMETAKMLLRDHKPFSMEIYKRIGWRIRKLERRIEILLFKDTRQRLEEFIKDLAKEKGEANTNGTLIAHSLTQGQIGSLIGASRKSVSLMLNDLAREGEITFTRKEIFIPKSSNLF